MENKIYEYSKASSLEEHREKCIKKFYISQESNLKIDKLYNTYLIYDYRNDNGNIIINMFSKDNKLALNTSQKNILSSMIKSNVSIFKIEDMTTTKMTIRDYFTDNKLIVEDVDLFKSLNVNENIIGRFVNIQGMNILVDDFVKVSNANIKIILENIKQLYKQNNNMKSIKEMLIYNSDLIYKFAQQIILNDESYIVTPLSFNMDNINSNKSDCEQNQNIYDILKNNIEEKYLQKGLDLWKEYSKSNKSIKGSENGWAAAVEYYIKKDAGETITQAQVSEKYEISPRTLGKRYKQLRVS